MRSTSSGKRLYRFAGLALAFVLAVTAGVCALSVTSRGIPDDNTAQADVVTKPAQVSWINLTPVGNWNYSIDSFFNEPSGGRISTNIKLENFAPPNYRNFFFYNNKTTNKPENLNGVEFDDTHARYQPGTPTYTTIAMYAYYRLPDELVAANAVIDVSTNLDSLSPFFGAHQEEFKSVSTASSPSENNDFGTKCTGFSNKTVTSGARYIRVVIKMMANYKGAGIEIRNLRITVKVKSVTTMKPFVGNTPPVFYGKDKFPDYQTNKNLVNMQNGNYNKAGPDDGKNIVNDLDWDADFNEDSNIVLAKVRTDGTMSKSFSFVIYDHYTGIKKAVMKGGGKEFNLLDDDASGPDGLVRPENLAENKLPDGISKIVAERFGYRTAGATGGRFRGLKVTVTFDSKKVGKNSEGNPVLIEDERDFTYSFDYANNLDKAGDKVVVYVGGIDFTPPYIPDEIKYVTPTDVVDDDGVAWFSQDVVRFKMFVETDNRDKLIGSGDDEHYYRDVKYSYILSYNHQKPDHPEDYMFASPETGNPIGLKATIDPGQIVYGKESDATVIELKYPDKGLASGYYKLTIYAEDYVRQVNQSAFASHIRSKDFFFNVDANIGNFKDWVSSVKTEEYDEVTGEVSEGTQLFVKNEDGTYRPATPDDPADLQRYVKTESDYDGSSWTRHPVVFSFNKISDFTHFDYTIEYSFESKRGNLGKPAVVLDKDTLRFIVAGDKTVFPDSEAESWYCEEGFERTYRFTLTLESGKVWEFSLPVRFDDYAEETPYSSVLFNYDETNPYADLLKLDADMRLRVGEGAPQSIRQYDRGSPMRLWCTIGENSDPISFEASDVSDTDDVALDLFWTPAGVRNIAPGTGPVKTPIVFWFEDAAGNKGPERRYDDFWLDTARLYLHFTATGAKRFYDGGTDTPDKLLEYGIYKDPGLGTKVDRMDVFVTEDGLDAYETVYDGPDAGQRNVLLSGLHVGSRPSSVYHDLLGEYVLALVRDAGDGVEIIDIPDLQEPYAVASHMIKRARIAVGWNKDGAQDYSREYKRETSYVVEDDDHLFCIDEIPDGIVQWDDIVWKGILNIPNPDVVYDSDGRIGAKTAYVTEIELKSKSGNVNLKNFEATNRDGGSNITVKLRITPAPVTVRVFAHAEGADNGGLVELSKVYDQSPDIQVLSSNFRIEGCLEGETGSLSLQLSALKPGGLSFDPEGEEESVQNLAAKFGVLPAGKYYSVTVTAVLTGLGGVSARNYMLVDEQSGEPLQDKKFTFTEVTVTPRPVSAEFQLLTKVYDGRTEGSGWKQNEGDETGNYGKLKDFFAGDDVALDLDRTWWATPSADWGEYRGKDQATVHCELKGDDAGSYSISGIRADATIFRLEINTVKLGGIFVYDDFGRYWYRDSNNNLYVRVPGEEDIKYTRMDADGYEIETVTMLPGDAEPIVITEWFSGGICVINGRRIKLAEKPVFDFEYLGTQSNWLDPLDERNRAMVDNNFNLRDNVAVETKINVNPVGFPPVSSMTLVKVSDKPEYEGKEFTVIPFPDIAFDGILYNNKFGPGFYETYNPSEDVETRYLATERYLKADNLPEGYTQEWMGAVKKDVSVMGVGEYLCRIKITRSVDKRYMILEKKLKIDQAQIPVVLSTAAITKKVSYGLATTAGELSKQTIDLYAKVGVEKEDFTYQYSVSSTGDWKDDPTELVGGGYFWVRGIFDGDDAGNVKGNVSAPKSFFMSGAGVEYPEMVFGYGVDEVKGVKPEDILTDNYKKYAGDFVVVYNNCINEDDNAETTQFTTLVPSEPGIYQYKLVHKNLVTKGVLKTFSADLDHLYLATDFARNGIFIIGLVRLASTDENGVEDGLGVIEAKSVTDRTGVLPAVRADSGTLRFRVEKLGRTAFEKDNINNGLYEKRQALNNHYESVAAYRLALEESAFVSKAVAPSGVVSVTLKAPVKPSEDLKLILFFYEPDGSYDVRQLSYRDNKDGTLTFSTDRLGDFVFALPFTGKTRGGIGAEGIVAGVAGGVGALSVIFVVIGAIMKVKKRNIVG